jgi:hypothetical protein
MVRSGVGCRLGLGHLVQPDLGLRALLPSDAADQVDDYRLASVVGLQEGQDVGIVQRVAIALIFRSIQKSPD